MVSDGLAASRDDDTVRDYRLLNFENRRFIRVSVAYWFVTYPTGRET